MELYIICVMITNLFTINLMIINHLELMGNYQNCLRKHFSSGQVYCIMFSVSLDDMHSVTVSVLF